jgi:YidC/Oxa1 family membrane protein insertase
MNKNSAVGSLKMQKLQPRMKALQEKYKDDQQKLGVEMQKLYKEVGYNPMSGCLPMIVQMFILFALYNVFNNYFEFRGASFVKGWIDDLSSGDSIFSWNRNIPFISAFTMNNLRILPFVYTASQLLNGKITQYGNAGASTNQGQMKFMMYGMPVMFFFLFYNVPSGLLLYWATSNILQIGQQLVINRVMNKKRAEIEKSVDKNVLKFKGGKKKPR